MRVEDVDECLRVFVRIAQSGAFRRGDRIRVQAANALLDHYRWQQGHDAKYSPEARLIAMLGGPDKAARWLAENYDRLRAMLPAFAEPGHPGPVDDPAPER